MLRSPEMQDALLAAWGTSNRVTAFLVERIPDPLWRAAIPGIPTRTVRSIAAHLPDVAEAVHQLVNDPATVLDTTLFAWAPTTGWRRWPR